MALATGRLEKLGNLASLSFDLVQRLSGCSWKARCQIFFFSNCHSKMEDGRSELESPS